MLYSDRLTLTLLIVLPSLIAIQPGQAQITPDNSLGQERSLVNTQDELTDLIEGGAIRGDNLFHSFSEFNVGNDRAVYFASPDSIANILTRVTGNDLSNIFGTLGVEGTANLFLLNPHGIVLGENAMLDLSGSFLATTADSYIFKNDFAYSATNPAIPPLLTVNIPVGLQFGTTAQPITVQTQPTDFNEFDSPLGIGVAPQKNITLIGGNLEFTGGYLNAPEGSINLGSVSPDSFVEIRPASTDWTVNYQAVSDFQDITLTEGAAIDSSGNSSGSIDIQAKNFSVLESSQLKANNYAEASGKNITINATETVKISNLDIDGISGNITANAFGTGRGADLKIEAKSLQISDRGAIITSSRESGNAGKIEIDVDQLAVNSNGLIVSVAASRGNAGDVVIAANSLELSGIGNGIDRSSYIASTTVDRGNSGKIELNLGQVIVTDGAVILSDTFGTGDAGDMELKAKQVELIGSDSDGIFYSGIYANAVERVGNGGDITLETEFLKVWNGAVINNSTFDAGDSGNIAIKADVVEIGADPNSAFSGIYADARGTTGNAGNITLNVNSLLLSRGFIDSGTFSDGDGGNINIQARTIDLIGEQTGIYANAFAGTGNAGNLTINSDQIEISDRGNISVSSLGSGNSGNLQITTSSLDLDNSAIIEAQVNTGNKGNIQLTTDNISLNNRSQITAIALGTGVGGNIAIDNTENIVISEASLIIANAVTGNGGNIDINTQGYFIADDSTVSASSEFGLDGNVEIEILNSDRQIELDALPKNILSVSEQITTGCASKANTLAITGKGGLPENPRQHLRGRTVWQDHRLTTASPQDQDKITNLGSASIPKSPIEAQAWQVNKLGTIELIAFNSERTSPRKAFGCNL